MPELEKVEGSEGPTIVDANAAFVPQGSGKGPWYLWTRMPKTRDESSGHTTGWFAEGMKVTKTDLGLNDDQFQELIDAGVVRETEYPVPANLMHLSPNEFYKRQLAIAAGEEVT